MRSVIAIGLGLLMGIAGPASAFADEPATDAGIQWVEGWDAGLKAASKANHLMFVYVGRKTPR